MRSNKMAKHNRRMFRLTQYDCLSIIIRQKLSKFIWFFVSCKKCIFTVFIKKEALLHTKRTEPYESRFLENFSIPSKRTGGGPALSQRQWKLFPWPLSFRFLSCSLLSMLKTLHPKMRICYNEIESYLLCLMNMNSWNCEHYHVDMTLDLPISFSIKTSSSGCTILTRWRLSNFYFNNGHFIL